MTLSAAAKRAREIADTSTDPFDHARANAMDAAVLAESARMDRSLDPEPRLDDIEPWSQISEPGTSEGPLPF